MKSDLAIDVRSEHVDTQDIPPVREKEEIRAPSAEEYLRNRALWFSTHVYVNGVLCDLGPSIGGGF